MTLTGFLDQKRPGRPLISKDTTNLSDISKRRRIFGRVALPSWTEASASQNATWDNTPWPEAMLHTPPDSELNRLFPQGSPFPSAATSTTNHALGNRRSLDLDLFALEHEVPVLNQVTYPTATATVAGQGITTATDISSSDAGLDELPSNDIERLMNRLARMNSQIYRSAQSLANVNTWSLDTTNPCVTAVFENANALIGILDTCRAGSLEQKHCTPVPGPLEHEDKTEIFEPATYFLILACHQSVLGAFDAICYSILESLKDADTSARSTPGPSNVFDPRELTSELGGSTMEAPVTQYVMLTALISHFLERLDRALRLLAHKQATIEKRIGQVIDRVYDELDSIWNSVMDDSSISGSKNETHHPPNPQNRRESGSLGDEALTTRIDGDSLNDSFKAAIRLIHATQARHERLLQRLRDVRKLVSTNDTP